MDPERRRAGDQRRALAERLRSYTDSLLRGNPDEVRDYWTPDARVLLPGLKLDGPGLTRFVEGFYGGGGRVVSAEFHRADLFVHEEAAYELGSYEETAGYGDGSSETVTGNYFLRWERSPDGTWRIDRFVGGPVDAPAPQDSARQGNVA